MPGHYTSGGGSKQQHPLLASQQSKHGSMSPGGDFVSDEEAALLAQIQRAVAQPPPQDEGWGRFQRERDPNGRSVAVESAQDAIVGLYADNPPDTPVINDPRVPDYWSLWRELSGVEGPKPVKGQEAPMPQAPAMPSQQAIGNYKNVLGGKNGKPS